MFLTSVLIAPDRYTRGLYFHGRLFHYCRSSSPGYSFSHLIQSPGPDGCVCACVSRRLRVPMSVSCSVIYWGPRHTFANYRPLVARKSLAVRAYTPARSQLFPGARGALRTCRVQLHLSYKF